MIQIFPCDFLWPDDQSQNFKQLPYGEYLIQDIVDMIQNDLNLGQAPYIYGDKNCERLLQNHKTLIEQGIQVNSYIFARKDLYEGNLVNINITIDNNPTNFELQVQNNASIDYLILQLLEQQQIPNQIISVELLNANNGQKLTTDKKMEFGNFPTDNFELKLYTQSQANNNKITTNKSERINQARTLLKQLLVFPAFSILVDDDSQFVVYKFHHPLNIKGYLAKQKAMKMKVDDELYDFKTIKNVQYAQIDQFGILVKWDNQLYSKVRIKQKG